MPLKRNVQWIAILLGLVGLNLAAAVYYPTSIRKPFPSVQEVRNILNKQTRIAYLERGGWLDRSSLLQWEGTIVYEINGSVVVYDGRAGHTSLTKRVIIPPAQSFLRYWSPVIASFAITLVVLGFTTRKPLSEK